jgi:UDP-N-acetylmuramoyl-tripeptide--D-alanyl-D-alanine ligase
VARHAKLRGIEALWLVGPWAQAMASEFGANAADREARVFESNDALIAQIRHTDTADAILVKGSRSTRMEMVVAALCGTAPLDSTNSAGDH